MTVFPPKFEDLDWFYMYIRCFSRNLSSGIPFSWPYVPSYRHPDTSLKMFETTVRAKYVPSLNRINSFDPQDYPL